MNEKDKKLVSIVGEALEQIVLPEFEKISERFDKVDKRFDEIDKKLVAHDEEFVDVHNSLNRIELKLDAVVVRQDNQGDDILKIQKVLKLEPKV